VRRRRRRTKIELKIERPNLTPQTRHTFNGKAWREEAKISREHNNAPHHQHL
jgi:hypothetical protein